MPGSHQRDTISGFVVEKGYDPFFVMPRRFVAAAILLAVLITARAGSTQTISQRGFVEVRGTGFAQEAPNDPTRAVADLLVREEVFVRPAPWLRLAAGADLRANSHDQVDDRWRIDLGDRGRLRPAVSIRRATATISRGPFTIDVGQAVHPLGQDRHRQPDGPLRPARLPQRRRHRVPGRQRCPRRWRRPASRTHSRWSGCRG